MIWKQFSIFSFELILNVPVDGFGEIIMFDLAASFSETPKKWQYLIIKTDSSVLMIINIASLKSGLFSILPIFHFKFCKEH